MKILAFGASTSSTSINQKFANYTAHLVPEAEVTGLDLRRYRIPIYSEDLEESDGKPTAAQHFVDAIKSHDAVIISLAEHNGSYTAAFKNLYDWASRIEYEFWSGKPMLLLATSPGGRGGGSVLASAEATFPRMGADIKASFSLPSFYDNFSDQDGIIDAELARQLALAVQKVSE